MLFHVTRPLAWAQNRSVVSDEPVVRAFPLTRQSTLAALRGADEAERRRGLEKLANAYWRPVYGYLRLHWRLGHEEAADLAQDFFAQLVDKDLLARFDPERARLRTYLRVCIDGLVANQQKAARRLKRGGGRPSVPFDVADARAEVEAALGSAASPEALFEKEWARSLLARALVDVQERCAADGRPRTFEIFEAYELGAAGGAAFLCGAGAAVRRRRHRRDQPARLGPARAPRGGGGAAPRVHGERGRASRGDPGAPRGRPAVIRLDDGRLERLRESLRTPDLSGTRYELAGIAGSGGTGTVYVVRDAELGRRVALKVLDVEDEDLGARLRREAQVLAQLEHPGIVPVHEVGTLADGRLFYTMKLVDGERLDRHVTPGLSLAERLRLFLRIADAVGFAHAHGVVHRDLKPANIMVGPFGEVLVLDWGLAKRVGSEAGPLGRGDTASGAVLGTPGFMAPEQQAGGSAAVDARADIYSLGAILESLLPSPSPAALRAVAAKAMAAAPADRYPDVAALARDVTRFLDGERVSVVPESLFGRARRLATRHRLALGILGAYLLGRSLIFFFLQR